MPKKTYYQKWTKIPLTPELTQFLYECYYQLSQEEGELLKAFQNGIFLIKGEEKFIDKNGNLRKNFRKNYPLRRINLSVIQVKGQYYYRIFINQNRIHIKYNFPPTNHSMIQISHKENVFKHDMTFPQDYKGNNFVGDELTKYLKENQYLPENGYQIANYLPTQPSEFTKVGWNEYIRNPLPKLVHKIPLTKAHRILNEWNIVEKYLTPYLKELPSYYCFNSNNMEKDYLLVFQEIKAKHHPLTFPLSDSRYLYCRIAHETELVLDRILYYLIDDYHIKY